MDRFIARENIDLYLGRLRDRDLSDDDCAVICKLLIEQEDKLAHDLEQLGFAEERAERGRQHLRKVRALHDEAQSEADRIQMRRLLVTAEETQQLLDAFCERLRRRALGM